MQTIVFIETNKSGSSREAIKAAERLGYLTVLFTRRKKFLAQRTEFPDVHQMYYVSRIEIKQIRKKIHFLKRQGKQIVAVLSFVDPFVQLAAQLSEDFCHSLFNTCAISKMEDKIQTRQALEGLSISPFYQVIDQENDQLDQLTSYTPYLPLIVKAPVSTGSKDVLLVEDLQQLQGSVQSIMDKYRNQSILIEEYMDGPQYLLEVFVQQGNPHIVAVIEQEISKQDRFIVTGYGLLAVVEKKIKKSLEQVVKSIVKAIDLKNGSFHVELKNVNGQWKVIEINPRISGGVMNRLIEVGFGINLVEETVRLFTGKKASLLKQHSKFVYAHYMTVSSKGRLKKVTGKQRALRHEGVEEVYIKPRKGAFMTPPLSMGHRYGYVLASAYTLAEAKTIAQKAAKEIQFHLYPL
ncbi:ATP-grasp domain-containing protein [Halalkalibacter alkalisediminis]|uniref:ATP-grasp domain-containing protein n=1 Tax=Halalkalibacter alkalisediminis TaxID=935616 RepID=A0ABV6NNX6_9BACI|nr:ATP-grasp domain-containing protein [Halalkalibacter alkalisediminis]